MDKMAPVTRANAKGSRNTNQLHLPAFFAIRKRGVSKKSKNDVSKKLAGLDHNKPDSTSLPKRKLYGILADLPPILCADFLEHLSAEELLKLSMVSMGLYELVTNFVFSGAFLPKLLKDIDVLSAPEVFQRNTKNVAFNYGRLLKMATVMETPKTRIEFLVRLMEEGMHESNMSAWGMVLTTYSDLWKFNECMHLLNAVLDMHDGALRKLVAQVLLSPDGTHEDAEMQVKHALHKLFLDMEYIDQAAYAFWLAAVLNELTTSETRPKLFLLLYLEPVEANGKRLLDWRRMVTEVITSYYHSMHFVAPIAKGLSRLISTGEQLLRPYQQLAYTRSGLFNLVEEITTYPEPWSLETYTALHIHEPSLICISIEMRMQQRLYAECGNILAQIKNMATRWNMPIEKMLEEPIRNLFKWLRTPNLRKMLLAEFVKANANHYAELLMAGAYSEMQLELVAQDRIKDVLYRLSLQA